MAIPIEPIGHSTTGLADQLAANPSLPTVERTANIWNVEGAANAYAEFSQSAWYNQVLCRMVGLLPAVAPTSVVVDMGSGTGRGSIALSQRYGSQVVIVGVDSASSQVAYANHHTPVDLPIFYREGDIQTLEPIVSGKVQGIVAFNSVHLLGDLRGVLQICGEKVETQGFFAFCSGYTSRMFSQDTEGKAMEMILKIREAGRKEFRAHFSAQSRRDTPENRIHMVAIDPLEQTLADNGFSLKTLEFQKCLLDRGSIINFMVLPGVGDSILPESIPVTDRRRIIGDALDACEIQHIARNWCLTVAEKY